ncbi:MAG: hypothetical protein LBN04_01125 [Oscillospiraceae bacterium]|jgi:hypothetical protein|nr:hypothetical protein [Oscillospiraceae bacterium]
MLPRNFAEFCAALSAAGFSMAGGHDQGVIDVIGHSWDDAPADSPLRWHTGDAETDPWQWRIRVLDERNDIAYGKLFFRKAGYITRAWYPHFLAVRRNGRDFEEGYQEGLYSRDARQIYAALAALGAMPAHLLRAEAGFGKGEGKRFEKALVDLQMGLFITASGQAYRQDHTGAPYGWPSMLYCTTEQFWGDEVFEEAEALEPEQAATAIAEQILRLTPKASPRKLRAFIASPFL